MSNCTWTLSRNRPKMGHLVREAAAVAGELKQRKERIQSGFAQPSSDVLDHEAPWYDSLFMKACRREPVEVTPILVDAASRPLPAGISCDPGNRWSSPSYADDLTSVLKSWSQR